MEFDSLDNVKEIYTSLTKKEGFGVRIRCTKENFWMLVHSNEGKHMVKRENGEEDNVCIERKK